MVLLRRRGGGGGRSSEHRTGRLRVWVIPHSLSDRPQDASALEQGVFFWVGSMYTYSYCVGSFSLLVNEQKLTLRFSLPPRLGLLCIQTSFHTHDYHRPKEEATGEGAEHKEEEEAEHKKEEDAGEDEEDGEEAKREDKESTEEEAPRRESAKEAQPQRDPRRRGGGSIH
jgi:hypothetical protein